MSQTLKLTNWSEINITEQTQLTAVPAVGASSLAVGNTNDFEVASYILIGATGAKGAELLPLGSVTNPTSLPLGSPTTLPHNQYDPIYALFGNQIRIYRTPNVNGSQPADAAFNYGTPYATVNIDPNDASTLYTDPTGSGNYWYKATYYNSTTTNESDISQAVAVRGNFTAAYCSLDEIRREAGFKFAPYVTDDQIDEKRQAAQDEINGALDEFYQTPLQPPIPSNLKNICIVLAAGYLRSAQYSQISDPQVNGQNKIDWAELELDKLILKERVLVDKSGKSLDSPGATGGVEGWPNASTIGAPKSQGGAPRVFRMGDIQGQPMARDADGNPVGNLYYGRKW